MLSLSEKYHPLAIPLLGLVAGTFWGAAVAMAVPLWGMGATILLLALALRYASQFCWNFSLLLFWSLWACYLSGHQLAAVELSELRAFCNKGSQVLEGVIAGRPEALPTGERLDIAVDSIIDKGTQIPTSGTLRLAVADGRSGYTRGDRVRFRASPRIPDKLGLPGEFDYPRFLAFKGVSATASIKTANELILIRAASTSPLRRLIDRQAEQCRKVIHKALPVTQEGSIVSALVTGNKQEVPKELASAYALAGVAHILAISGFHLGIISLVLILLLTRIFLYWEWLALRILPRRAAMLCSLPLIVWYLLFTGAAPATVRSAVMLIAVALAFWSERENSLLSVLLTTAFLMLLFQPLLLFAASFQLSFLALWGIIVLTPQFIAPFEHRLKNKVVRNIAQLVAASAAASLATAIPALITFKQASFNGVISNLLVVPLLGYGATLIGAFSIPLLLYLPIAAKPFLSACGWLVNLSNQVVEWAAALPVLHAFNMGYADLVLAVLLLLIFGMQISNKRKAFTVIAVLFVFVLLHFMPDFRDKDSLRLTFLSVGQSESTLLELPDGRTMLIDGGGYLFETESDFGERYLLPALRTLGVKKIDYLVLSHPHPDHLGGLPAVAEQMPVGEFWQGPWQGSSPDYWRLRGALKQHKVPLRILAGGDQPLVGNNLTIKVYAPFVAEKSFKQLAGDNEDSLVLAINYGYFSALFTGDAGLPTEQAMAEQGLPPSVTLLKVGHHGSRSATGEPFLERLKPELAVISVGRGNRFGLPTAEVVGRLVRHNVQLYRTDQDGTIRVETDGIVSRITTGVTKK